MTNLMCRGRKRGLAGVIATQRLAKLAKNVAAEASNFLMGRTFLDIDMARAADLLGMERRQAEMFRDLRARAFRGARPGPVPPAAADADRPRRDRLPRGRPAPDPLARPGAGGGSRELILRPGARARAPLPPRRTPVRRRRRGHPGAARRRPAPPHRPSPVSDPDAEAAASARWSEHPGRPAGRARRRLPSRAGVVRQDFLVRARIRAVPGPAPELPAFRARLATARAGVAADVAAGPDWAAATALAGPLPEDARGVFLLLARAALERAPCPSDAAIAAAYGTRSAGRARRLLAWLEEQGAVVVQQDRHGRRVAIVGPGWETAPGDAAAEAA